MKLTKEFLERIEGLTMIDIMDKLEGNIEDLVADYRDEGFEDDDIEAYLILKIKEVMKPKAIESVTIDEVRSHLAKAVVAMVDINQEELKEGSLGLMSIEQTYLQAEKLMNRLRYIATMSVMIEAVEVNRVFTILGYEDVETIAEEILEEKGA